MAERFRQANNILSKSQKAINVTCTKPIQQGFVQVRQKKEEHEKKYETYNNSHLRTCNSIVYYKLLKRQRHSRC